MRKMTIPFNNVTTSEKNQCSELVNYSIFRNIFVLSGNKSDESNQQIMLKTLFRYMLVYFKLSSHKQILNNPQESNLPSNIHCGKVWSHVF